MILLPPFPNNTTPPWKGMTLEEMQMRRALVQARMEIQKFKLTAQLDACKQKTPLFGGNSSLFSRLASAVSFAEYGFLALKLFRTVLPWMRRKK